MKFMKPLLLFIFLTAAMPANAETTRWYSYEEGILAAGAAEKPIILDFYADWCPPCIAMEERTYPDPRVERELVDFIAIKVDTQKRIDIESKYGITYYPTVVFLDPKGKEVTRHIGYLDPEGMVGLIKESRGKLPKETPGFETLYLLFAVVSLLVIRKKATGWIS